MTPITPFTPLKLLRHAGEIEQMLRGETVYPISVEFDLSNTCPHDCAWCSFGTSESQGYRQQAWVQFPTARALSLLEELACVGTKSITFTGGGEPLVHRDAAGIFEKASSVGLQWGVVTNGWMLRGAVQDVIARYATFVRVSLDAGSPQTHQVTHRVAKPQYHQILDQLWHTRAKSYHRPLTIGASFCVQSANWREIYQAARDVKEHGGDYLEVRPVYPTDWRGDGWGEAMSEDEVELAQHEIAHARVHLNDETFQVIGLVERFDSLHRPAKGYRSCHIGPLMTVIGADQNVWHWCVQRGQREFLVGSIADTSFKDLWDAQPAGAMREKIDVGQCPRCRYDGYNRLIEDAVLRDRMHRDFL